MSSRESPQSMLFSHLKTAVRSLLRSKGYTFINVAGLAVGVACCLLILIFVRHELSFDRYHADADRTVRVTRSWTNQDGVETMHLARIAAPIAPLIEEHVPGVDEAVRAWETETSLSRGADHFTTSVFFVEDGFADLFSVRFLQGSRDDALAAPYSLVLTQSAAQRFFGSGAAVGASLELDGDAYTVTAVVEDPPSNTHFPFEVLGSFSTLVAEFSADTWANWGWNNYATYLRLREGVTPSEIEAQLPGLLEAHYEAGDASETRLHVQPITEIHLYSHLDAEIAPNGDVHTVILFSTIAFFLLVIACFNFVNLTTARAARRAREVGMRKAIGASRRQLVRQFLGEALLLTLVALVAAVLLARLALPFFNELAGTDLSLFADHAGFTAACLTGILAVVGLAAGSYPAFYLSAFQPIDVLKGGQGRGRSSFRTGLVVGQFAVATALIIGMAVVFLQLDYVRSARLGFDPEQLVVAPTTPEMRDDLDLVLDRLRQHPGVVAAAGSQRVPSDPLLDTIDGAAEVRGMMQPFSDVPPIAVTSGFVETFGLRMAAGRSFSSDRASDSTSAVILNEAAVSALGWTSPEETVGKAFTIIGNNSGLYRPSRVIGVVEDFHFESLHEEITPMLFLVYPDYVWNVTVRVAGRQLDEVLDVLEETWAPYQPDPLQVSFVDQAFGALYEGERRLGLIFSAFAGLAVFIACLGLLGLASFMAARRTKEIGVRKVLGASVASVVLLLSRDFARPVLAGVVLAAPFALFGMSRWLDSFAYHTRLPWWTVAAAAAATMTIAIATVSYQTLRAALADPAKSIRYE